MLLKQLFESAELPADFATKAETIFEAAVSEKVNEQLVSLQEAFDNKLSEEKEKFITESVEILDKAIEESVLEWAKENAVGIDNEVRSQLAESFLTGLKGLFEKADIELGENSSVATKEIQKLQEQVSELTKQIEAKSTALVESEQKLVKIKIKEIISDATEGLADTVVHRVTKLCESFDFKSEEDFRMKTGMIVEAVSGKKVFGTVDTDGTIVPVTKSADGKPAQAKTESGDSPDPKLVSKPADEGTDAEPKPAASIHPFAGKTPDSNRPGVVDTKGDPLKEQFDAIKNANAPHYGEDLVALTMKLLKK